mmetsp:Transcript_55359/g.160410  ORF Transcript_55359/g.160410 Transcript_55359/m.160410 type:complete len:525 (+) Transcript_55359:1796-3370(+)
MCEDANQAQGERGENLYGRDEEHRLRRPQEGQVARADLLAQAFRACGAVAEAHVADVARPDPGITDIATDVADPTPLDVQLHKQLRGGQRQEAEACDAHRGPRGPVLLQTLPIPAPLQASDDHGGLRFWSAGTARGAEGGRRPLDPSADVLARLLAAAAAAAAAAQPLTAAELVRGVAGEVGVRDGEACLGGVVGEAEAALGGLPVARPSQQKPVLEAPAELQLALDASEAEPGTGRRPRTLEFQAGEDEGPRLHLLAVDGHRQRQRAAFAVLDVNHVHEDARLLGATVSAKALDPTPAWRLAAARRRVHERLQQRRELMGGAEVDEPVAGEGLPDGCAPQEHAICEVFPQLQRKDDERHRQPSEAREGPADSDAPRPRNAGRQAQGKGDSDRCAKLERHLCHDLDDEGRKDEGQKVHGQRDHSAHLRDEQERDEGGHSPGVDGQLAQQGHPIHHMQLLFRNVVLARLVIAGAELADQPRLLRPVGAAILDARILARRCALAAGRPVQRAWDVRAMHGCCALRG